MFVILLLSPSGLRAHPRRVELRCLDELIVSTFFQGAAAAVILVLLLALNFLLLVLARVLVMAVTM